MRNWLCLIVGCAIVASGVMVSEAAPKKSPADAFKAMDKDNSGTLTLEEFSAGKEGKKKQAAERVFKAKDKDKDGSLTLEEFTGKKKKNKK